MDQQWRMTWASILGILYNEWNNKWLTYICEFQLIFEKPRDAKSMLHYDSYMEYYYYGLVLVIHMTLQEKAYQILPTKK